MKLILYFIRRMITYNVSLSLIAAFGGFAFSSLQTGVISAENALLAAKSFCYSFMSVGFLLSVYLNQRFRGHEMALYYNAGLRLPVLIGIAFVTHLAIGIAVLLALRVFHV